MEIAKNKTEFTKKCLTSFQNLEILRRSWLVALCALGLIILSFTIRDGKVMLNSIPFLVIGASVLPFYVALLKIMFIIQNKKFKKTSLEYVFTDQKIMVSGKNETTNEQTELHYTDLVAVKQTKKFIYLYINKVSALVVDKSGFTSGSAEKLLSLIDLRCNKKQAN